MSTVCGGFTRAGFSGGSFQLGSRLFVDMEERRLTLPPRTSSPMIRHAAVWICRLLRSAAIVRDVKMELVVRAAELWR